MDEKIIKSKKIVKIIGIVDIIFFSLMSIFLVSLDNLVASLFFIPFIVLGIVLIVAYQKQRIILEEDQLTLCHIIKKKQQIKYQDIHCLLLIPLNNKIQMALIDQHYNRLITLDETFTNFNLLFKTLDEKNIKTLDFAKMIEKNKDVSKYVKALNVIEKNFYKAIVTENKTLLNMSKKKTSVEIENTKRTLKLVSLGLTLLNLVAFLLGGKKMFIILIIILLISYAIYIKHYPYIYIETNSKKGEEQAFQMPFIGASIALILCVSTAKIYNYIGNQFLLTTIGIAVILVIPYIIKSTRISVPQRLGRKISVVFMVFAISFSMTFPLNYLLTFERPTHKIIVITNKRSTSSKTGDYYLYGNWNGKNKSFSVSSKEYYRTSIGDRKRICIRQSILGLKYYTVHE